MAGPPQGRRPPGRRRLSVVAHNTNGLRSPAKRHALFSGIVRGQWDVAVIVETHTAADDDLDAWLAAALGAGRPLPGRAFWAHGRRGSRGVAILLGNQLCGIEDASVQFSDGDSTGTDGGRVLRVGWHDGPTGESWSVVAVYAPNDESARRAFFAADGPLARALDAGPANANVVVAGDFNCILDPTDSSTASAVAEASAGSAAALRGLLAGAGLADAWLEARAWAAAGRGPARRGSADAAYTFFSSTGSARRLDRTYVSDTLISARRLVACQHIPPGDPITK